MRTYIKSAPASCVVHISPAEPIAPAELSLQSQYFRKLSFVPYLYQVGAGLACGPHLVGRVEPLVGERGHRELDLVLEQQGHHLLEVGRHGVNVLVEVLGREDAACRQTMDDVFNCEGGSFGLLA